MKGHKTVSDYIKDSDQWRDELAQLRSVAASTELTEELKWGAPCHMFDGKPRRNECQSNPNGLADDPVGNRSERQVPLLGRERKQGNAYSDDCREDHQQNHVLPVLHRF